MARLAIVGSCITRDIWPVLGEPAPELLYVSRTSLPSLMSTPVAGVEPLAHPPEALSRSQNASVLADLRKTTLASLEAFEPTHIVLDMIDERYDLLAVGEAIVTHSWDLKVSGYLSQPWASAARRIPRTSAEAAELWKTAAGRFAAALEASSLADVPVILHEAQWASDYLDAAGQRHRLTDTVEIWEGLPASIAEHNALLAGYGAQLAEAFPKLLRVGADPAAHVADAEHRWGLSPFHYVRDYYAQVRDQLRQLGV
ncbi:MAG TPA: DUF6270 domain-containing protein [Phenylobacterium sp.]